MKHQMTRAVFFIVIKKKHGERFSVPLRVAMCSCYPQSFYPGAAHGQLPLIETKHQLTNPK